MLSQCEHEDLGPLHSVHGRTVNCELYITGFRKGGIPSPFCPVDVVRDTPVRR